MKYLVSNLPVGLEHGTITQLLTQLGVVPSAPFELSSNSITIETATVYTQPQLDALQTQIRNLALSYIGKITVVQ